MAAASDNKGRVPVTGPLTCFGPVQVPDEQQPYTIYGIRFATTPKRQISI